MTVKTINSNIKDLILGSKYDEKPWKILGLLTVFISTSRWVFNEVQYLFIHSVF